MNSASPTSRPAPDEEPGVFVVRHGETEWSAARRHTGRTDLELTPAGEREAVRAGDVLRSLRGSSEPALALVSPRRRARRTAELLGLPDAEVVGELAEWDYGDYEGLSTPEIQQRIPGWTVWTHPCPGGETADEVGARADAVLDRARAGLTGGDVVLVCHGHLGRVLAARWIGLPTTAAVHLRSDTAAVTVLGHDRGVPQLRHVNIRPGAPA